MAQSTDRLVLDKSKSLQEQLVDIMLFVGGGRRAQGDITFSGQPNDADTITIADGVKTATVFEFESGGGVGAGNVSVTIGANAEETLDNLLTAINARVPTLEDAKDPLAVTATKSSGTVLLLKNDVVGTKGNVTVTESATGVVVTGMTKGADVGQIDTEMTAEVLIDTIDIGSVRILDSAGDPVDPATAGGQAGAPVKKTPTVITKAVVTPGTGLPLAATPTEAVYLLIVAKRATGNNVGDVFIGSSTVDEITDQQAPLQPGQPYELSAPDGVKFDLNEIFVDAANALDGVTGFFLPA